MKNTWEEKYNSMSMKQVAYAIRRAFRAKSINFEKGNDNKAYAYENKYANLYNYFINRFGVENESVIGEVE